MASAGGGNDGGDEDDIMFDYKKVSGTTAKKTPSTMYIQYTYICIHDILYREICMRPRALLIFRKGGVYNNIMCALLLNSFISKIIRVEFI